MNSKSYQFRPERMVVLIAVIWYTITAYQSIGYYHADEHFQVIEFAGVLTGNTTGDLLPWEFREQIRPTLQPVLCASIFKACSLIGINEPHTQAFLLRLLTAILSIVMIGKFCSVCRHWIQPRFWMFFLVLSYSIWFLPMIMVRYSSETWSALALLACLVIVIRGNRTRSDYIYLGFFAGIAFLFRFQIALALMGLLAWMLFIRKDSIRDLLQMIGVSVIVVSLGTILDSWYYGELTLTYYNYLHANLIQEKAADFGTSAWFNYFVQIYHGAYPLVAIIIYSAVLILAIKDHRNILLWIILPFFFIHTLIGHKELRFLFPLAPLIPIIIVLAAQELPKRALKQLSKKTGRIIIVSAMTVNLIGMVITSWSAPGEGRMRLTKHISDLSITDATLVHFKDFSPYKHWGLPCTHYSNKSIVERKFRLMDDYSPDTVGSKNIFLVIREKQKDEENIKAFIDYHEMQEICAASSENMQRAWGFFGYERSFNLQLYQNRKK